MDPHIYLKFKINRVKVQNNTSANCGEFCCEFLDKMYHGGKFKEATRDGDSFEQSSAQRLTLLLEWVYGLRG